MSSVADFGKMIYDRGVNITADTVGATQKAAEAAALAASGVGRRYHFRGRGGKKWPLTAKVERARAFASKIDRTALARGSASPREFNAVAIVKADPMGFWAIAVRGRKGSYPIYPAGYRGRQAAARKERRAAIKGLRGRARREAQLEAAFAGGSFRGLKPLRTPYGPRYWVSPGPMRPLDADLWDKAQRAAAPLSEAVYARALASSIRKHTARPVTLYVRAGGKLKKAS